MNLNDLSKEQKQYIILGLVAAVILVTLLVLGIRFSLASIQSAKDELGIISDKIASADRTLSRSDQVSQDYRSTMETLKQRIMGVPPQRNYYSWATEVIYSEAGKAGLEIDSIDEIGGLHNAAEDGVGSLRLESYALRMNASGGFNNVKDFMQSMKEEYPLVRFTGLDISSGQSPEMHNIQLWLQWPFNLNVLTANWDSVEAKQRALEVEKSGVAADEPAEERAESPVAESDAEDLHRDIVPQERAVESKEQLHAESTARTEPPPPPPRIEAVSEADEVAPPADPIVPSKIEPQFGTDDEPPIEDSIPAEDTEDTAPIGIPSASMAVSGGSAISAIGTVEPPEADAAEPDQTEEPGAESEKTAETVEEHVAEQEIPDEPEAQLPIESDLVEENPALVEPDETMESVSEPAEDTNTLSEVESSESTPESEAMNDEEPQSPVDEPQVSKADAFDEIELLLSGLENTSDVSATNQNPESTFDDEEPVSGDEDAENTDASADTDPASDETAAMYVTTEKSTQKLEAMLVEQNDLEGHEALDALLDSLIGDQP
jgi:hypothetical protein